MKTPKKDPVVYVCEGSCHAQITKEQYDKGLVKCGAKSCSMHGHPFKKLPE